MKGLITLGPGAYLLKPFMDIIYEFSYKVGVGVPDKPFHPTIVCGKAGAYPSEAPFRLLASPTNIGLGRKCLKGTNTSLLRKFVNYGRKKFCRIGSRRVFFTSSNLFWHLIELSKWKNRFFSTKFSSQTWKTFDLLGLFLCHYNNTYHKYL